MYYLPFCPGTYRIAPGASVSECVAFGSSCPYFYSPEAQNDKKIIFASAKKSS